VITNYANSTIDAVIATDSPWPLGFKISNASSLIAAENVKTPASPQVKFTRAILQLNAIRSPRWSRAFCQHTMRIEMRLKDIIQLNNIRMTKVKQSTEFTKCLVVLDVLNKVDINKMISSYDSRSYCAFPIGCPTPSVA
jgi:hypothetical protein